MIPKLRFPEFEDDYTKETLGAVSKDISYGIGAAAKPYDFAYRYLRITDIDESSFTNLTDGNSVSPNCSQREAKEYILDKGDVVLARTGASVGKMFLNTKYENLVYAGFLIRFKVNSKALPYYLTTSLQTQRYNKWVSIMSVRSGQPGINAKEYSRYPLNLPSLQEQKRVSSLFASLDQKITLLTNKKEALETYKKGLMQKIFSQELRFKREDGTDYPEWSYYCIAEMGEFFNGLTGKNSSHFGHGDSQYVQYSQVFRNSYIKLAECDNVDVEDSEKQNALKVGDALFTTSSEVADEVAFASILLNKPEIDTYLNSFCFGLRLNSLLAPSFAQYLFRTTIFRKAVYPLAQGSTRYNVSKKEVGKVKLLIPSVEEQNHIAKSFRILDSKIEQLILLKKKTEQLKKGLLQQMFV